MENCISIVPSLFLIGRRNGEIAITANGQKYAIKNRESGGEVATAISTVRATTGRAIGWRRTGRTASLRQQSGMMGAPNLPASLRRALRLDSADFRVSTKRKATLKNEKYFPNGLASESTKGE